VWTGQTLWDTSAVLSDSDNEFGAFLRALLGYQDRPTFAETYAYAAFWVAALACLYAQGFLAGPGRSHARGAGRPGAWGVGAVLAAMLWALLEFVYACSSWWHPWVGFATSVPSLALLGGAAVALLGGVAGAAGRAAAAAYLFGGVVWHAFVLVVILLQMSDQSGCFYLGALLDAYAAAYGPSHAASAEYAELAAGLREGGTEISDASAKVTRRGGACGSPAQFGFSFSHQLFVLNGAWLTSPRDDGAWHSGAALTVALVLNSFGALVHVPLAFHLWWASRGALDGGGDAEAGPKLDGDGGDEEAGAGGAAGDDNPPSEEPTVPSF